MQNVKSYAILSKMWAYYSAVNARSPPNKEEEKEDDEIFQPAKEH